MIPILVAFMLTGGTDPAQTQCRIDVRVVQLDPGVKPPLKPRDKLLAEPAVVTLNGRPAIFRLGDLKALTPNGITGPGVGQLTSGVEFEVVPLVLLNGTVRLEMAVTPANAGQRVAVTKDLECGERFRLPAIEGLSIEVVVSKFAER